MQPIPRIDAAQAIGGGRLLIRFRNGKQKVYDCSSLFSRSEFRLLANPAFFQAVQVDAGGYGISWNDDIDLSEYELWTNGEPIVNNAMQPDAPMSRR